MKIKEIAPVVAFAAGFASRVDEQRKYVRFVDGKAYASSGEDGAVWEVPDGLDGIAAPAEQLAKVLSSLSSDHDEVEITRAAARVVVKAGKFRAQLPLLVEEQPPLIFPVPDGGAPLGDEFWAALEAVSFTIGPPSSPVHNGVYWAGDGTLITTDRERITAAKSGVPCPDPAGVLIPARFVKLTKYGFNRAAIDDGGRLWFIGDGGAAWTILLAVQFPASTALGIMAASRARAGAATTVVMPDGVSAVLDRLFAVPSRSDAVLVELTDGGSVRLSVPDEDGAGSAEETVSAEVRGPSCSVTVGRRALKEALQRVSMTMTIDGVRPVYLRGERSEHVFVPTLSR
jgi:hypothetical protein